MWDRPLTGTLDTLTGMTLRGLLRRDSAADRSAEERLERCFACDADLRESRSYERHRVCHACGHHYHLNARQRVATILDPGSFRETDRSVTALDPIQFRERQSYRHRVLEAQRRTGLAEAAFTGTGALYGREVVIAALDFSFLGGSIGVASGERLARAFERAASRGLAVVTVLSTSGVRMREGLLALMQLPRLATAHQKLAEKGLPHVTLLSDPSTGSAFAGLANLADFIIAEPNALVGYSALREMRERTGEELPEDAHTSESHLRRGLIDAIVRREDLRPSLGLLIDLLMSNYELRPVGRPEREPREYARLEAWRQVQLSRHENRPTAPDFIRRITTTFVEIHGDRSGEDDPSISAASASSGARRSSSSARTASRASPRREPSAPPASTRLAVRCASRRSSSSPSLPSSTPTAPARTLPPKKPASATRSPVVCATCCVCSRPRSP